MNRVGPGCAGGADFLLRLPVKSRSDPERLQSSNKIDYLSMKRRFAMCFWYGAQLEDDTEMFPENQCEAKKDNNSIDTHKPGQLNVERCSWGNFVQQFWINLEPFGPGDEGIRGRSKIV
ncbi:hypothetical protein BTUL_0020g00370 [Botrytis tulipae]|uniref:Uncharacterized protein n=1 Tax=Botrytis tulipae TaxID=87230 RepID=A0A4Z1F6N7_9HELO|nr:hypothetical protein BTUL_0020g00370 [Botrytis tulipae]